MSVGRMVAALVNKEQEHVQTALGVPGPVHNQPLVTQVIQLVLLEILNSLAVVQHRLKLVTVLQQLDQPEPAILIAPGDHGHV